MSLFDDYLDTAQFGVGLTGATQRPLREKIRETLSVKDFGAVGDGVTDDKPALDAVGNYLRTLPLSSVVDIHWPTGDYLCAGRLLWTNCPSVIIHGNGSTLKNTQGRYTGGDDAGGNSYTLFIGKPNLFRNSTDRANHIDHAFNDRPDVDATAELGPFDAGDLIDTASPGDNQLTLKTVADALDYEVGDSILIYSELLRADFFPPQLGKMEWRKVVAVDTGTGVLTVGVPVVERHHEDQSDSTYGTVSMGKPRVINLTKRFVPELIRINDFTLLGKTPGDASTANNGTMVAAAVNVQLNNCNIERFWPQQADLWECTSCTFTRSEYDKVVNRVILRQSAIESLEDGGTSVARSEFDRCILKGVQAQRANWHELRDCQIKFTSSDSQSFLRPYYQGGAKSGGSLTDCDVIVPASAYAQIGFRNGLDIGESSNRGIFSSGYTVTNSGGTTTSVTMAGGIQTPRDQVWPGRRFVATKSGGFVFGRVISSRIDGANVITDVSCTGEMTANGYNMAADWRQQWSLSRCQVLTTQLDGRQGFQNFVELQADKETVRAVFRPDLYQRVFPETSYIACLIDEYIVDVRVPYTGVDAAANFTLTSEHALLDGSSTGTAKTLSINLKVAGRRTFGNGIADNTQTGDSATAFDGSRFLTRLTFSGSLSEWVGGSDDASVMPEVQVTLVLRRIPDRYFP